MGGSSTPDAPDYVAAAEKQGEYNLQALQMQIGAGRVNQSGPFGSSSWSYTGNLTQPTLDDYMSRVGSQVTETAPGPDGGFGSNMFSDKAISGAYTEQMAQEDYQKALNSFYEQALSDPGSWTQTTTLSPEMQAIYDTGYGAWNEAAQNMLANPLDTSGLMAGGDWSQLTSILGSGGADKYSQAYYDQATSMLGDKYAAEEQAMRSQLLNQGLTEGSEAYNREMGDWLNAKNANYSNIANQAILTGSQLQNADISSLVSALTATDAARANQLSEASYMHNQPLSDAASILKGLQVPNYTGQANSVSMQPIDYMGAVSNQYNADLAASNAESAQTQNLINSGLQAAALAFMLSPSDRRLKGSIVPLGRQTQLGFPLYSYVIFGKQQIGVMADEVEAVMPDAVHTTPAGIKLVDYSKVGGF